MAGDTIDTVRSLYPTRLLDDLASSGLEPGDMRVRAIGASEKAATSSPMGADGYVIPYFDLQGKPLPFYRVKLYDQELSNSPKYRQAVDTQNHIYCPPRLASLLPNAKYLLIVEGEKKAARAVKAGVACIGVSGVYNWKSRTLVLPGDTTLAKKPGGGISAKLPAGAMVGEQVETLAVGFLDAVYFAQRNKLPVVICFDSDVKGGTKFEVQRAAAMLGFELRYRGLPQRSIRQLILPNGESGSKVGVDDFLEGDSELGMGPAAFEKHVWAVLERRSAFPLHPNIREHVNRKLSKSQMSRPEQQALAIAVLADLDAKGQRLRSKDTGGLYYFSSEDKSLTSVDFTGRPDFAETPFGRFLYKTYNISINDQRLLGWISTQFSGEEPIAEVSPERVLAWRGDTLYYQVNDGAMARVTKDGCSLIDNGEDNVLFESGVVLGLDTNDFKRALYIQSQQRPTNWWLEVLKDARIRESENDNQRKLLSLLYYISPMFYRWRGTQLPVEITTGEAGSGKSTLFELRLSILTGVPTLRNAPSDLRDWNASLAGTGAIHVTDNLQFSNNDLRQRLSDEICRLVTEPSPTIEQRKLYTDTGLIKIPVRCTFAVTAIRMPFVNVDIIQRSIITELDKGTSDELKYDAEWKEHQLDRFKGREQWLAHQLVFVQRVLQSVHAEWKGRYQAKYRLINVEQLLGIAGKQFGWSPAWIADYLEQSRDKRASETDWALEGLSEYAEFVRAAYPTSWAKHKFSCADIATWAEQEQDFAQCNILTNSRSLGRYMNQHKHTIATTSKIIPSAASGNKSMFKIKSEADNG